MCCLTLEKPCRPLEKPSQKVGGAEPEGRASRGSRWGGRVRGVEPEGRVSRGSVGRESQGCGVRGEGLAGEGGEVRESDLQGSWVEATRCLPQAYS